MTTAEKNLESETAKLQARIDELEAELKTKRSRERRHAENDKFLTETVDKTTSEASRLLHALSLAFVEELRSAADVVKAVSDEAFKRREDDITEVRIGDLRDDITGVLNKGIEKSLAAPGRVIDKFHEVYHQSAAK